jgi:predicted Na+-dependent transporter
LVQALFKSTVQLVLLPTVLGLLGNEYFKKQVNSATSHGAAG